MVGHNLDSSSGDRRIGTEDAAVCRLLRDLRHLQCFEARGGVKGRAVHRHQDLLQKGRGAIVVRLRGCVFDDAACGGVVFKFGVCVEASACLLRKSSNVAGEILSVL